MASCGNAPSASQPAGAQPGGGDAGPRAGYSVVIPPGWHRADRALTDLTDPVEILVAATYEPRAGDEGCGPAPFAGFDSHQVLVTVLERGLDPGSEWSDFPPRPAHFAFEEGMTSEFADCLRTERHIPLKDHWFRFTDAGRHFHVLVVIGADAPAEDAQAAYRMLDSLRFDPSVEPDWRSSG